MTWWSELYDDDVARLLFDRHDPAEQAWLAGRIADLLELEPGDRVLDQCCGTGAIATHLADRGHAVVGVDQAASYVREARRRIPGAELHCADASDFVADPRCAAGFNWNTSFGYHPTDEDNQRMLRAAFESLEPGGRFALDFMNIPGVMRNFQAVMVDHHGELHLIRRTIVELATGTMWKKWTFVHPGRETATRETAVKMYMPHQLVGLMKGAGFADIELYGGPDREELTIQSMRCVAVGRRPG